LILVSSFDESARNQRQNRAGGPLPWWSYVIGLQNIWMNIDQTYDASWLAGTWSLAIEKQFYLIFPLVVYFASFLTLPRC
jgi:peptidoglycan/LPS O-acetylase OafA/YrhL